MSRVSFPLANQNTAPLTVFVMCGWLAYILFLHEDLILYLAYLTVMQSGLFQLAAKILFDTVLVIVFFWTVPRLPKPRLRGALLILLWVALVVSTKDLTVYEALGAKTVMDTLADSMGWGSLLVLGGTYAILLAIPFVPGVELGFMIIIFFGARGALVAYLATFLGLSTAFLVGRLAPKAICQQIRARFKLNDEDPLSPDGNLATARALVQSSSLASILWRYRPLVLAALFNLPGNAVFGGGGGLALATGLGRLLSIRAFVITVLLATAPIPALTALGLLSAEKMLEATGIGAPPPPQTDPFPFGAYQFSDFALTIDASGSYKLERNEANTPSLEGTFILEGGLIKLHDNSGPMACSGSATGGKYWWSLSQGQLTFERVHDFCRLRAWFLDRAQFSTEHKKGLY